MVYAIKITRSRLRPNSRAEKVAMTEVFANAALMKHKHVVRYFNSRFEAGKLYIQQELCQGSLEQRLDLCRKSNIRIEEEELRKIQLHVVRGLQYIHSKQMAHLDIKPANILVCQMSSETNQTPPLSPDSGAISGRTYLDESGSAVICFQY